MHSYIFIYNYFLYLESRTQREKETQSVMKNQGALFRYLCREMVKLQPKKL